MSFPRQPSLLDAPITSSVQKLEQLNASIASSLQLLSVPHLSHVTCNQVLQQFLHLNNRYAQTCTLLNTHKDKLQRVSVYPAASARDRDGNENISSQQVLETLLRTRWNNEQEAHITDILGDASQPDLSEEDVQQRVEALTQVGHRYTTQVEQANTTLTTLFSQLDLFYRIPQESEDLESQQQDDDEEDDVLIDPKHLLFIAHQLLNRMTNGW
jgi:hypothetical protein